MLGPRRPVVRESVLCALVVDVFVAAGVLRSVRGAVEVVSPGAVIALQIVAGGFCAVLAARTVDGGPNACATANVELIAV